MALYKHQADRQLREQREWLRVTLTSIGDAVIATDTDGRVTFLNPVAESLTGWKTEEAPGQPIQEVFRIVNEQTGQPLEDPVARVLREGRAVALANHTALVTRDGRTVPIEDSAAPILDAAGQVIGAVLVFHDVTEKRRAEEALRRSHDELEKCVEVRTVELVAARDSVSAERQRLYDVLETLPVYVVLLAPDYHVPFANRFFRERFGESGGKRCYEYLFNRTEPCEICETYSVMKTNSPHHWYWTGPDKRDYDIYDYPFVDADGSSLILEMGIDITEQKQAERALKEINETLEERIIERTAQLNSAFESLRASRVAALNLMEDAVAARKEAEETAAALRESEERLRLFIEYAPAGLAMFDREMRYLHCSRRWRDDYRLGDHDHLGISHYEIFPEISEEWREAHRRGLAGEVLRAEADRFVRADGTIQWVRWEIRPWRDATGNVGGIVIFAEDITDIKLAEIKLLSLNKALKAMSDSSQAVIRAGDEAEYLDSLCRIIVEDCGYSMVWIGFAENDEAKSVRPVSCAGFEEGYLDTLQLTWADTERGRGPTGTAIRAGKVAMCRNMLADPAFTPWRAEALKRGYASSIGFPLMANQKAFGAVTIYSPETDPFSESEVKLLAELVDNVSYGLEVLRIKDAQKQAVEALRERERSLAEIVRKSPSFVCILRGPDHVYEMANEKYFQLIGERDILGKKLVDALPEIAGTPYMEILDRVYHTGEPFSESNASIKLARGPEGYLEEAWLDFIYLPLREPDGTITGIFVHGVDITERRRAEMGLRTSYQRSSLLAETTARLLASDSPQKVVEELCRRVMEVLDCQAFFNFLVDEKRTVFVSTPVQVSPKKR